jgi:sec-independent protein translocase protein TatA
MIAQLLTPTHLAILLVALLLVLGPKRVPESGRALGRGVREFRDAITGHNLPPDAEPAQSLHTGSGQDRMEAEPLSAPGRE